MGRDCNGSDGTGALICKILLLLFLKKRQTLPLPSLMDKYIH